MTLAALLLVQNLAAVAVVQARKDAEMKARGLNELSAATQISEAGEAQTRSNAQAGRETTANPSPGDTLTRGRLVRLELRSDSHTLALDEEATLTVRVRRVGEKSVAGLPLEVQLPPALTIRDPSQPLRWFLPNLKKGESFRQTLAVERVAARGRTRRGVAQVVATIAVGNGQRTLRERIAIGLEPPARRGVDEDAPLVETSQEAEGALLLAAQKRVALLSPRESVPRGTLLRYTHLRRWDQEGTSSFREKQGASAVATAAASSEGEAEVGWLEQEIRFYHTWQLDAWQQGAGEKEVSEFADSMRLVVDASWLRQYGIEPEELQLYTRESERDEWQVVPSRYVAERQLLVTQVDHFSLFGLGDGLTTNEVLPSLKGVATDRFTGGASINVGIETPTGLGGLSPNLSLSYSSVGIDDLTYHANGQRYLSQVSSVGMGWNLGGVSYITTIKRGVTYALVLNGSSVTIRNYGGQWQTDPALFAKVERFGSASSSTNTGNANDYFTWKVTMPDGTAYEFGDANSFNPNYTEYGSSSPTATRMTHRDKRFAVQWYLRKVSDPLGNEMVYSYREERNRIRNCISSAFKNANRDWYSRATYPTQVQWSRNPGAGASSYTLRVLLNYATSDRADYQIFEWQDHNCHQAMFGKRNRLTAIVVQVLAGTWQTLRTVQLNQSFVDYDDENNVNQERLILNSISQLGKNGGTLQTQSFTYTGSSVNSVRLRTAENGWGGKITFTYAAVRTKCTPNSLCNGRRDRHVVTRTDVEDGMGNSIRTDYNYGGWEQYGRIGFDDTGMTFLGFSQSEATYYDRNSTTVLKWELMKYHQGDSDRDDARAGKLYQQEIRSQKNGSRLFLFNQSWQGYRATSSGGWSATNLPFTESNGSQIYYPMWVRKTSENATVSGAYNEQRYFYESSSQNGQQFGNVTRVEEWDGGSQRRRVTLYEFYPNTSKHIVNLPARVRVFGSGNDCHSESRILYGTGNVNKGYKTAPLSTLVVKSEEARTACSSANSISTYDSNWRIVRYIYDAVGNQTEANHAGASSSQDKVVKTQYESQYRLFPIAHWNSHHTNFKETARYHGVNGPYGLSDSRAFWRQMAEFCQVNGVCTRQAYDEHGRPTHRWERQTSASWASPAAATVKYSYKPRGSLSGQQTYIVVEAHAPRCHGNFVRRHYNGLGELVVEQRPWQDWEHSQDGCGSQTGVGHEVDTYYQYDALGNQTQVSVPRKVSRSVSFWTRISWSGDGTQTRYDALGRITQVTAPNGEKQLYSYSGRQTKVVDQGTNRVLRWTETDSLGTLKRVRSYTSGSQGVNNYYAQVSLTHDILGNLTRVSLPSGGTATMSYNLLSEKLSMDDPDLGHWTYAYDRHGNLTRQTDARNKSICLYYHARLGRLLGKHFRTNTACPSSVNPYDVRYLYDTSHSSSNRSRGQLTQVFYHKSNGYIKALYYNDKGLLASEHVIIPGAPTYITRHTYESDSFRLRTMRYPDGEVVTTTYNSMGLPKTLSSSSKGLLVDGLVNGGVAYHAEGRVHQMRLPHGTDLFRTQMVYGWGCCAGNGNHRLREIRVGTSSNTSSSLSHNRLRLAYTSYDSMGNIKQLKERYNNGATSTHNFSYDHQNRLISGYGKRYGYRTDGTFASFEGQTYTYDAWTAHSVNRINGVDRYDYDQNGNMVRRNKGLSTQQTLVWNHENQLSQVKQTANNRVIERYLYDDTGIRIKKWNSTSTVYTPFPHYEVAVGDGSIIASSLTSGESTLLDESSQSEYPGLDRQIFLPLFHKSGDPPTAFGGADEDAVSAALAPTVTKYYFFNGQRIGMQKGSRFYYLHSDHLGSTLLETATNSQISRNQRYFAFGSRRSGSTSPLHTDNCFTGQKLDTTGLMYYNARYYDPTLGHFVSPDSIVPDPTNVLDYNRFLYVRGNPLKYNDPTGHRLDGPVFNGGGSCAIVGNCYTRLSQAAAAKQEAALFSFGLKLLETTPYADTPNDVAVTLTGCGYNCQAGYEEPVGWGWRTVAAAGIVGPFGYRLAKGAVETLTHA
ncbi:hypothetical protein KFU94_12855 [Chloroflexi bacterium TSY]|nr:hypothetical protein [Chloroflexi bacterium TSY]